MISCANVIVLFVFMIICTLLCKLLYDLNFYICYLFLLLDWINKSGNLYYKTLNTLSKHLTAIYLFIKYYYYITTLLKNVYFYDVIAGLQGIAKRYCSSFSHNAYCNVLCRLPQYTFHILQCIVNYCYYYFEKICYTYFINEAT